MGIAPWRIVERIGEDRLGTVDLAVDTTGRTAHARRLASEAVSAPGVRDRLLAACRAAAALPASPGIIAVLDVAEDEGSLWVFTEPAGGPLLRDVTASAGGDDGLRAAAAYTVLDDLAHGLLALHRGGTAHGALSQSSVVVSGGDARLRDPGLLAALLAQPSGPAADAAAWADLARALRSVWAPGHRVGEAIDRAAERAGGDRGRPGDLAAALAALAKGRGALGGADGRQALRAMASAAAAGSVPTSQRSAPAATAPPMATFVDRPMSAPATAAPVVVGFGTMAPVPVAPEAHDPRATMVELPPAGDPRATVMGVPDATVVGSPQATVMGGPQATVMGAPQATVLGGPAPSPPTAAPGAAAGRTFSFGSGPPAPVDAATAATVGATLDRTLQRGAGAAPVAGRRRRRGRGLLWLLVGLLLAAGIAAAILVLRDRQGGPPAPALSVSRITVTPDRATAGCGQGQVVFTATLTTNGIGGAITYRWERQDGTVLPSGTESAQAGEGNTTVTVTLTDQASGHGTLLETARLHVLTPKNMLSPVAAYRYTC